MYIPKISTKRVLGLVMASALAVSGTVAMAGSSEAAVAAVRLTPTTGSSAGGTVVTITGKDFQNAAGTSKVGIVWFSLTACVADAAPAAGDQVLSKSVTSATKVVVTTKALNLTATPKPTVYFICVQNTANDAIIGTSKFTSYLAPFINTGTPLTPVSGSALGGGSVTITGENFTTKTTATIGGKKLTGVKVVIGSGTDATAANGDDTLTGVVPAGTGATAGVIVTSQGGSTTLTPTFNYLDAIKVSPAFGTGTDNDVITISGSGFLVRDFAAAAVLDSAVAVVAAGTNIAVGQPVPVTQLCDTVQVESDTVLSCQLNGALADGAYSVVIITRDGTTATDIGAATAVSRSATYSVSDF